VKALAKIIFFSLLCAAWLPSASGQSVPLSERMAATVMTLWKDSLVTEPSKADKWNYEQGVLLKGIEGVWYNTGDGKYFKYIQRITDRFVNDDGTIRTYKPEDYNLDNVLPGRNLLLLYKVTGQEKYRKAAALLRK
jgi:unsaturated rhamnogalacturonyl hydrolase